MDLSSLLKLAEVAKIDLKAKTATLHLGLVTIDNIPLGPAKELSKDPQRIARILSKGVISRRCMWEEFRLENADYIQTSLHALSAFLDKELADLDQSTRASDRLLGTLLQRWQNQTDIAMKRVRDAITMAEESQRTEIDREFQWEAHDDARNILAEYRGDVFPIISAIVGFLPNSEAIRRDAERHLSEGRDKAVCFGVPSERFQAEDWELNPA
jgi:hypothetical protein